MFRLLALIFSSPLMAGGWAEFSTSFVQNKGKVDFIAPENNEKYTDQVQSLSVQSPAIKGHWDVNVVLDSRKRDYSYYLVRAEGGEETPLSDTFDRREHSLGVTVSWQREGHIARMEGASSLGRSPFAFRGGGFSYDRVMMNKRRTLGVKVSSIRKKRPPSTYIDPRDFLVKKLSAKTKTNRYDVRWEEVLTQWWKINTIASYGTRHDGRPDHYGLEWRNGLGFWDEVVFRNNLGLLKEKKGRPKDNRGVFDVTWVEWGVHWELAYDFSLEASYGMVREREKYHDGRGSYILGTDSYGIQGIYEGVGWRATVAYVFRNANINYRSHSLQGGIRLDI